MINYDAEALFLEAFRVVFDNTRAALKAQGGKVTQRDVAAVLGLRASTVSEWLRGKHRGISLEVVNRVARQCQLPVARLFMGADVLRGRSSAFKSVRLDDPRAHPAVRGKKGGTHVTARATTHAAADQLRDIRTGLQIIVRLGERLLRQLETRSGDGSSGPVASDATRSDRRRHLRS